MKPFPVTLGNFAAAAVCVVLLALFVILASRSALRESATYDEPLDIVSAWGQSTHNDFRCNPEDPPLPKYLITLFNGRSVMLDTNAPAWGEMLNNVGGEWEFARQTLYQTSGNDADKIIANARLRTLTFGLLLGIAIAAIAWRCAGPMAAVVSTTFYALDPNFIAHAPLVKDDVPSALGFFLLAIALYALIKRATWMRIFCTGLALGMILVTKFTGVLAIPIVFIALACRAADATPWKTAFAKRTVVTFWERFIVLIAVATFVGLLALGIIWASYGFRFSMSPSGNPCFDTSYIFGLCSHMETFAAHGAPKIVDPRWLADWHPSLTVRIGAWCLDHHALPEAWTVGFLYSYAQSLSRGNFLWGNFSRTGWWYYFPLAVLFKTPVASLLAFFVSGIADIAIIFKRRITRSTALSMLAIAAGPALYLVVAMSSNVDIGIRHVLIIYPFLFVMVGVVAASMYCRFPKTVLTLLIVLSLHRVRDTLGGDQLT